MKKIPISLKSRLQAVLGNKRLRLIVMAWAWVAMTAGMLMLITHKDKTPNNQAVAQQVLSLENYLQSVVDPPQAKNGYIGLAKIISCKPHDQFVQNDLSDKCREIPAFISMEKTKIYKPGDTVKLFKITFSDPNNGYHDVLIVE